MVFYYEHGEWRDTRKDALRKANTLSLLEDEVELFAQSLGFERLQNNIWITNDGRCVLTLKLTHLG